MVMISTLWLQFRLLRFSTRLSPPCTSPKHGACPESMRAVSGTFAGSPVRDGLGHVPVVTLLAVMAVTSRCVVSTVQTDTTTPPPWQLVELHIETTTSGMQITVACWVERSWRKGWNWTFPLETSSFYYNALWILIRILGDSPQAEWRY